MMSFRNPFSSFFATVLLFLVNSNTKSVSAFSTRLTVPPPVLSINLQWLSDIFSSSNSLSLNDTDNVRRREELKMKLLETCSSTNDMNTKRKELESIIEALVELRPIDATASNPIFQKNWLLQWTTEKEINFFSEAGLAADVITQSIDYTESGNGVLCNTIPLPGKSFFGVTGSLTIPDEDGVRTNFEFTSATLSLWDDKFAWTLPPVGKGWFDTVYLDDDLRIDLNSRDDILICTADNE